MRLFLSADLVGSTEFKTTTGLAPDPTAVHPLWVQSIRQFYRQFPVLFAEKYAEQGKRFGILDDERVPELWKTIGDEIVFCGRVFNLDHFSACILSFLHSIEEYGAELEAMTPGLDVKGSAWIAAFPSPNITVSVYSEDGNYDHVSMDDERLEKAADDEPHKFDFLGKDIDTGFRITRHSGANKLAMSCEVALLLCEAASERLFREAFIYGGRESLKGVMKGKPYPIINIDTERHRKRREIAELERTLTNKNIAEPSTLGRFLECLFSEERMEKPMLLRRGSGDDQVPLSESYKKYVSLWDSIHSEVENREKGEEEASREGDDSDAPIDQAITDQLEGISSANNPSGGSTPDAPALI